MIYRIVIQIVMTITIQMAMALKTENMLDADEIRMDAAENMESAKKRWNQPGVSSDGKNWYTRLFNKQKKRLTTLIAQYGRIKHIPIIEEMLYRNINQVTYESNLYIDLVMLIVITICNILLGRVIIGIAIIILTIMVHVTGFGQFSELPCILLSNLNFFTVMVFTAASIARFKFNKYTNSISVLSCFLNIMYFATI